MKKFLLFIGIAGLALSSCQKEPDFSEPGTGGGGGNGTLLVRMVQKDGPDSTVSLFGYNNAGKLTSLQSVLPDTSGGMVPVTILLNRNGQGNIQQLVIKSDEFASIGIDSLTSRVNYDAGNRRYHSRVTAIEFMGFSFRDSSVYEYNADGQIKAETGYLDNGFFGGYQKSSRSEYTYTGRNLTGQKVFSVAPVLGTLTEELRSTYTYDDKTNPLILGNEAILIGSYTNFSANNVLTTDLSSATDPSLNQKSTVTYTYNAKGLPTQATSSTQGGGTVQILYTYQ